MSQTRVDLTPPPAPQAPGARQWAALAVLTLAVTLLAIDSTVLALAIPSLSADLGPTATQLLWIGDVYSFTLAGLLVTMGNLADRIGRRRLLLIGTTGFGVSSVLAALAPSATALIVARALLGISGATIMPSTLSLIRNIFPGSRHRTTAIAVWSAGSSGGTALGPLVGGVLLEHFWWGSVFLINVPVMAAVVVTGLWLLPESRNDDGDPVDVVSAVLSVAAIVPVVYAVKSFAHDGPTLTAATALVAGAVAGRVFLRRQRRLTTPLIDVGLFRRPAFTWAVVATVMAVFALAGLLYFFSQYLQLVRGYSTLQAGLTELPTSVSSIAVVAVVAWLVRRLGHGGALGGGLVLSAAGLVVVAVAESWGGIVLICVGLLIIGTGVGLAFTVSTGAVLGSVPASRAGAGSPWGSRSWGRSRTSATGFFSAPPQVVSPDRSPTRPASHWPPWQASRTPPAPSRRSCWLRRVRPSPTPCRPPPSSPLSSSCWQGAWPPGACRRPAPRRPARQDVPRAPRRVRTLRRLAPLAGGRSSCCPRWRPGPQARPGPAVAPWAHD